MAIALPIDEILADLRQALNAQHQAILEAPPGAGKTTRVPLALLDEPWLKQGKILMLQPRRVAARASAERMAHILGEELGQTVGYRIRNESKVTPATRIEVITEGILTRQLQHDPSLEGVALVIFDEFHERNLDSDLSLALVLQSRSLFREHSLKILVMSATLGSSTFQSQLRGYLDNAPLLRSEGRSFPVETFYHISKRGDASAIIDSHLTWLYDRVVSTVKEALDTTQGNILVFLPGRKEIKLCLQRLSSLSKHEIDILPLHGSLSIQEQRRVVAGHNKRRRIILSTDIAETSLTIDGVSVVIDSGLVRVSDFDANTATTRLHTRRISKASSVQRAGRAGRLAPGKCFRLWSESQQGSLIEQRAAEILEADLAPMALQLLHWGAATPAELNWLDPPPTGHFHQAIALLKRFAAIEERQNTQLISDHGKRMASLPLHPRLAHMLIKSAEQGASRRGANLAALLSERDNLNQLGCDTANRLDIIEGRSPCPNTHTTWLQTVKKQSQRFFSMTQDIKKSVDAGTLPATYAYLSALAYPDRIALRGGRPGSFKLSNGRLATLDDNEALSSAECLVILDLGGKAQRREDRIYRALQLDKSLFDGALAHLLTHEDCAHWDDASGRYIAQTQVKVGQLKWQIIQKHKIDAAEKQQALLRFIQEKGLDSLPLSDAVRSFQARVALAKRWDSDADDWPKLDDDTLLGNLSIWLGPYLDNIKHLSELSKLPLLELIKNQLSWAQQSRLDTLLPSAIKVPSGSLKHIDYLQSPPVLAVKLQEMFGAETSPSLLHGKISLSLHLLSPARRPLQITQDLAAFWRNAYQDVKKEMRGRYPKHPWPDDPVNSLATAYTKKRSAKP